MVVSVKPAANAAYYFQGRAHLKRHGPEGTWLSGHRGLVSKQAARWTKRRLIACCGG